ncbi:MAG TPA: CDP-alcohol phosphatidyltransferase family protein [Candidatus Binataceae bacterium]|nr:CDP-alcohol phosphatidyltransferase family protein [Candidatus Binataceae bacterium]
MPISSKLALIANLKHPGERIFGRCVLERVLILCERAGCNRFVIVLNDLPRPAVSSALGAYRGDSRVSMVPNPRDAFADLDGHRSGLLISGDLVFFPSHLRALETQAATAPDQLAGIASANSPATSFIAAGTLERLKEALEASRSFTSAGLLPFTLEHDAIDRVEAQRRLAIGVRTQSAARDSFLARALDRKLSWQLSLPLAGTRITPNQITIVNSMLGVGAAWLFALPHYWYRLAGALLFVVITTLDGVDGEVARLKLLESEFGAQLDIISDTIVNFIVFIGIYIGCYRVGGNSTYLHLIALLAGGYGLCALVYFWAVGSAGAANDRWAQVIDRCTSRDFSYLLLAFALLDILPAFAWGTALGSYLFAIGLALAVVLKRSGGVKKAPQLAAALSPPGQRERA